MSSYTKATNFATKDGLASGDVNKIVKGTEIDTEFTNIQTAVNSKADSASPTITGAAVVSGTLTVIDGNFSVLGSADGTKKWRAEVDGVATATTRVGYVADEDSAVAQSWEVKNLTLTASVAANALTIAVKTKNGTDPSATDPIIFKFRNATITSGDYTSVTLAAANSLVISNGSTLGTIANVANRYWIVGFNDAGTFRLGAINCLTTVAGAGAGRDVTASYPLRDDALASSIAEGGAGAADSPQVIYTGTAVTSRAMHVLGYLEYNVGLGTAGVYASGPTKMQLFGPGISLPGQVVQSVRVDVGTVATGTTILPVDNTIPQNTEGDQYMSLAIVPTATPNSLLIQAIAHVANSAAAGSQSSALFQDATANGLSQSIETVRTAADQTPPATHKRILASTTSSTTFKIRAGSNSAGTTTFNGTAGAGLGGGVSNSFLEITELMG